MVTRFERVGGEQLRPGCIANGGVGFNDVFYFTGWDTIILWLPLQPRQDPFACVLPLVHQPVDRNVQGMRAGGKKEA